MRETRLLMICPTSRLTPDVLAREIHAAGKDIKISASEMASLGYILIGGSSYTIRAGKTITLTRDGILSTSPKISLKKYVDNGYMYLLYR